MKYPYILSAETHTIHIADGAIDAGRIIELALALEGEFPGAFGDDNEGLFERRPVWNYRLQIGDLFLRCIVVRSFAQAWETEPFFAVMAGTEEPRPTIPFAADRTATVTFKRLNSQLLDCEFVLETSDRLKQALIRCDWLDTSSLTDMLSRNHQRGDELWINPAYQVLFEMRGFRFRVDRNGANPILRPTGD